MGAEGHGAQKDKDGSQEDLHDAGQAGRRVWAELRRGLGTHCCGSPVRCELSSLLFLDVLGRGNIKVRGMYGGILSVVVSCKFTTQCCL